MPAGSSATTTSTATTSAPPAAGWTPSREALPRIERRLAALNPPPTRDIPVLIGGGGERKTLRLVARHADIWHGFGDAEQIARKHAVLDDWCAREGRDPGAIERSAGAQGDPAVAGEALYDAGTRLLTVAPTGPDYDTGMLADWLAWRDEKNAARAAGGTAAGG